MSWSPERVNNFFLLREKDLSKAVLNSKAILFSDLWWYNFSWRIEERWKHWKQFYRITIMNGNEQNDTENRENSIYENKR